MKKEEDWEEFFEDDATRELKQIFQGQAALTDTVRELHRKMDEIIGVLLPENLRAHLQLSV